MVAYGRTCFTEDYRLRRGPFFRWSRVLCYLTFGICTSATKLWILIGWGWGWRRL
jgi:hypothetical protein